MKRGPKKKIVEIDYFQGMLWVRGTLLISGLPHPTAIERFVYPKSFKPRKTESGGYSSPCHYNQIYRGVTPAGKKKVAKTNSKIPGSKSWYYHPFYEIARYPYNSKYKILSEKDKLQSKKAKSLFELPSFPNSHSTSIDKTKHMMGIFKELIEKSDWDALTAMLALMLITSHIPVENDESTTLLPSITVDIIKRLFASDPFYSMHEKLYEYIFKYFFDIRNNELISEISHPVEIKYYVELNRQKLDLIQELNVLKQPQRSPQSYLHVFDQFMDLNMIDILGDKDRDIEAIKSIPLISNLSKDLLRWEKYELNS